MNTGNSDDDAKNVAVCDHNSLFTSAPVNVGSSRKLSIAGKADCQQSAQIPVINGERWTASGARHCAAATPLIAAPMSGQLVTLRTGACAMKA